MMMRSLSSRYLAVPLLLAAAGLSGCDYSGGQEVADEPLALRDVAPGEDAAADSVEIVEVAARLEAAFRAAYGEGAPVMRSDDMGAYSIAPVRIVIADFGPVLVTEARMEDGCHACSGYLSVHYLRPEGGGYALMKSYEKAVPGSDWGNGPTEWSARAQFAAHPSIYSERGGIGQGYSCASGTIHELTPDGPRQIAAFPLTYSDGGAVIEGEATAIEGRIGNIDPGKSFDIVYTGTKQFTDQYVREGATYERKGDSPMETC